MLTLLGQLTLDGIAMGMVFVLLSAGIVFIMSVTGIFYLAYGQFYMIGAYLTWTAVSLLKLPFFVGLPLAIISTTILGLLSYRLIFEKTTHSSQKFLATIVAAMGLMLLLGQGGMLVFGTTNRSIPSVFPGLLSFGDLNFTLDKLVLVILSLAVIAFLFFFYERTRMGRAMRAVSFLPETASLMGINTKMVCLATVGIGTALAGFAGGIIAPSYGLYPDMGNKVILNVMLIAMLGGIDSLMGAAVAGIVVGLVLSFGQYFIGSGIQIVLFLVVGGLIFVRPGGLLGSGRDTKGFLGIVEEHGKTAEFVRGFIPGKRKIASILVLFALLCFVPLFITSPYHISLLITIGMGAILAVTFVLLLRTGLISMCIAAFWGVGAYMCTWLVMTLGWSFWLSVPVAVIVTGVISFGLGLILIRNPDFTFVIMTMVVGMLFSVIVGSFNILGGYNGQASIPAPNPISLPFLPTISFDNLTSSYYLLLFLALVVIAVFSAFYAAWTGRAWTAIGLNSNLASSIGINVFRFRLLAFVLAGATAGLMGCYYVAYLQTIRPDTFGMFKTVYMQIYAILGGLDFAFLGPLVGTLVMVLFPESMRPVREAEAVVTGTLVILIILFLPRGVLSLPGLRTVASDPLGWIGKVTRLSRPEPTTPRPGTKKA